MFFVLLKSTDLQNKKHTNDINSWHDKAIKELWSASDSIQGKVSPYNGAQTLMVL